MIYNKQELRRLRGRLPSLTPVEHAYGTTLTFFKKKSFKSKNRSPLPINSGSNFYPAPSSNAGYQTEMKQMKNENPASNRHVLLQLKTLPSPLG